MRGDKQAPHQSLSIGAFGKAPLSFGLHGGLLRFAHHPHCDRHIHHLIWVAGRPLCLGCTSMAIGIPVGLAAAAWIPWQTVPLWGWVAGHALLLLPTALQPFIQIKAFKIIARVVLGAASASYLFSGLVLQTYLSNAWLWRGSVVLAFAVGFLTLYKWRQKRINNPCNTCPLGTFPTCDWNMPRLLAQNAQDPLWVKINADMLAQQSKSGAVLKTVPLPVEPSSSALR